MIVKRTKVNKEYLRVTGRSFGYPECCIEFFIDMWDFLPYINKMRNEEMKGTYGRIGYIPCSACYNKLKEKRND